MKKKQAKLIAVVVAVTVITLYLSVQSGLIGLQFYIIPPEGGDPPSPYRGLTLVYIGGLAFLSILGYSVLKRKR